MSEDIHVVAISSCFERIDLFLNRVKQELTLFQGKKVILLFPEAVIGFSYPSGSKNPHAITRAEGKKLASDLHKLASAHGSAYITYSVLETFPEPKHVLEKMKRLEGRSEPKDYKRAVNAGYLIMPTKENPRGYQVYPKLTIYKQDRLTELDEHLLSPYYYRRDHMLDDVKKRAGLIKHFPEVTIDGKRIQLRICADALSQKSHVNQLEGGGPLIQDPHPARESKDIHLILNPSMGSNEHVLAHDLEHVANTLAHNGILVKVDGQAHVPVKVLARQNDALIPHTVEENKSFRKGRFKVHHKP